MRHHLSFLGGGKAVGGQIPRSEPDPGDPAVRDRRGAYGNGSSRHGCESNEVKVLCRQLLGIGRLAYPMHMKATTCVLLGWKRHGCPVVEKAGGAPPEQAPGPQAYMAARRWERIREPSTTAVGATGVASKLGGQNVRNDNAREKSPRSEVAERMILWLPTRSRFSGKADVVREETSKCTSRDRRGTGPSIQEKTRRSNVGKGHLPAGTDNNLQRPVV